MIVNPEDRRVNEDIASDSTRGSSFNPNHFAMFTFDKERYPLHDVPFPHVGYMKQNTRIMLEKTKKWSSSPKVVIAVDSSLKSHFDKKFLTCPTIDYCSLGFSNDYRSIGENADAIVTDKTKGLIVENNPALHFLKIAVVPTVEKPLEEYEWWGTDHYAGYRQLKNDDPKKLTYPPQIPFHYIEETEDELRREVDFRKKEKIVLFIIPERICQEPDSVQVEFLKRWVEPISREYSIKIFGSSFSSSFDKCIHKHNIINNSNELFDKACAEGNKLECMLRYSQAVFLFEQFFLPKGENLVGKTLWKTFAQGTFPFYFTMNEAEIRKVIPDPEKSVYFLNSSTNITDVVKTLDSVFADPRQFFSWKAKPLGENVRKHLGLGKPNFACRICEYVKYRRDSLMCIVDAVSGDAPVKSVNEYLSSDQAITTSKEWTQTFNETYITHYSPGVGRRKEMIKLMQSIQVEGKFVLAFDREALNTKQKSCFDRPHREKDPYRRVTNEPMKEGEMSLILKHMYGILQVLEKNLDNVLIFEDDTVLEPGVTPDKVMETMKYVPPNYSFVELGQCIWAVSPPPDVHRRIEPVFSTNRCAGTFAISRQGAILFYRSLPFRMPIDWQMDGSIGISHPDYRIYNVVPQFFEPSKKLNSDSQTCAHC